MTPSQHLEMDNPEIDFTIRLGGILSSNNGSQYHSSGIDGFQMSIKCPTSGGQAHNQKAASCTAKFSS